MLLAFQAPIFNWADTYFRQKSKLYKYKRSIRCDSIHSVANQIIIMVTNWQFSFLNRNWYTLHILEDTNLATKVPIELNNRLLVVCWLFSKSPIVF